MTSRSRITQTNICICSYSTVDRKDMCYVTNYTKTKFCKLYNIPYEFVVVEQTGEHCRSAKAEDLLSKDLTTVPTQDYYCNQYQSA